MSAVLSADGAIEAAQQRSEGVWHAAWRRFRSDRVGLASLVVVLAFMVLIALSSLGLVAKNWQAEVGVPDAPPTFMGPAAPQAASAIDVPKGPTSTSATSTRWRRATRNGTSAPRSSRPPRR